MYRKPLIFSVFLLHIICTAYGRFRYDYRYSRQARGWLKLHHVPATFNEAFLRCDQEGTVLASPSDISLQDAMKQMYPKSESTCGVYVGIHATISRGDYTTIEGVPLSQISVEWAPGEPQDYSEEEGCLIMLDNGTLAGTRCNESYPYFCYKKNMQNLVMNECGTVDPGYSLDKRTGSCYKFHRNALSWRGAYSTCLAEGGHLVIINSEIEVQVIKDLFAESDVEAQTVKDTFSEKHNLISIGILDWAGNGRWYTIHGQKLQEAGYHNWEKGQPSNSTNINTKGELCGSFVKTGALNDVPCEVLKLRYICEKDPATLTLNEYDFN